MQMKGSRVLAFIEFVGFLGFFGLMEQGHVKSRLPITESNSINTMNTINKDRVRGSKDSRGRGWLIAPSQRHLIVCIVCQYMNSTNTINTMNPINSYEVFL